MVKNNIKKIVPLLLFISMAMMSCSDGSESKNKDIVGAWVRESVSPCEVVTNSESVDRFIYADIKSYNRSKVDSYIFSKNERVLFIDSTYSEESMYQFADTAIVFSYPNGENITVPTTLASDKFSLYTDETQYYQDWVDLLFPDKQIEVSKVTTRYTYRKK